MVFDQKKRKEMVSGDGKRRGCQFGRKINLVILAHNVPAQLQSPTVDPSHKPQKRRML